MISESNSKIENGKLKRDTRAANLEIGVPRQMRVNALSVKDNGETCLH